MNQSLFAVYQENKNQLTSLLSKSDMILLSQNSSVYIIHRPTRISIQWVKVQNYIEACHVIHSSFPQREHNQSVYGTHLRYDSTVMRDRQAARRQYLAWHNIIIHQELHHHHPTGLKLTQREKYILSLIERVFRFFICLLLVSNHEYYTNNNNNNNNDDDEQKSSSLTRIRIRRRLCCTVLMIWFIVNNCWKIHLDLAYFISSIPSVYN